MAPFAAALAGIVVGALLSTFLQHRAWLRERRLTEYANLLTTFRAAFTKVGDAVRVREKRSFDEFEVLRSEAKTAVDEFLLAHDRLKLVATSTAKSKADVLWGYVDILRTSKDVSRNPAANSLLSEHVAELDASGHASANDFVDTAVKDVLHIRLRRGR